MKIVIALIFVSAILWGTEALQCVVCNSYIHGSSCLTWDELSFIQTCKPPKDKSCATITMLC
ncbi:hypothetical protein Ciccas_008722 [Cichlidogyrus casuarinus]|uniref:Uncharacterized protein n=1 Tax=Cichlidogyrus casuarinus TaxID=1844966 RepID=A0ABD2PZJ1_9PLAT